MCMRIFLIEILELDILIVIPKSKFNLERVLSSQSQIYKIFFKNPKTYPLTVCRKGSCVVEWNQTNPPAKYTSLIINVLLYKYNIYKSNVRKRYNQKEQNKNK